MKPIGLCEYMGYHLKISLAILDKFLFDLAEEIPIDCYLAAFLIKRLHNKADKELGRKDVDL